MFGADWLGEHRCPILTPVWVQWFSTFDLRSGYHNISIRESDKDKAESITRRGCFRYKLLPFGRSTAPSVFQRLMDLVLCELTYVTCLVYMDDIIVYASDSVVAQAGAFIVSSATALVSTLYEPAAAS